MLNFHDMWNVNVQTYITVDAVVQMGWGLKNLPTQHLASILRVSELSCGGPEGPWISI